MKSTDASQWQRVLSAAIAIPIVILLTLFTPPWLFALVVGAVAALAVKEFFSLAEKQGFGHPRQWFLVPVAGVSVSFLGGYGWVVSAVVAAAMLLMAATVFAGSLQTALGTVGIGL